MERERKHGKEASFKITGDWQKHVRVLKQKYPKLTDADLKFERGKENELVRRIATRLDMSRDQVIKIIKDMQAKAA